MRFEGIGKIWGLRMEDCLNLESQNLDWVEI